MAKRPYSTSCPACGASALLGYTEKWSTETRLKTYRCSDLECGMTFVTSESLHRVIVPSHLNSEKEKTMPVHIIHSIESFDKVIHHEPTIALFVQDGCVPCSSVLPAFNALAKKDHNHVYLSVDRKNPKLYPLNNRYAIQYAPTLLIFKNGNYSKIVGSHEIEKFLKGKEA